MSSRPSTPPPSRRSKLPSLLDEGGLVGDSRAMRDLGKRLTKIARSDATVLVMGESGTGKELVSTVIHQRSRRSDGPFVAVNCAALPETLLESHLFGHVRGAFTGAVDDAEGLFQQADTGTLFLDEVAELSPGLQAKLLRVLQERVIRPVGSVVELPVDVRLVTATNKDLRSEVEQGRFREDLLFRINVIEVTVPPLRDRGDDVILLAKHFLGQMAVRDGLALSGFESEALAALAAYDFPGNVRELQNFVEHAVAFAEGEQVALADLPATLTERVTPTAVEAATPEPEVELITLAALEARHIRDVLAHTDGNKTRAAEILGIDRRTLVRKLKRLAKRD